ncbi:type II CAAX endopeptidase family protein [Kribbella albertanoniae]|uniref:CPBP family intramembrane metalloprotease n=1 Tax=Kribbella albertanoniae TaxID=1266829 RepID=A0A4R4P5U0_9ACTN|nr:type II CAAX endopeptidase family protein [Kribbella albertanoniae]TDC16183.1 CPBP family intramembrane metalloprotease [Kribbella albertanoniae]
MTTNVVESKTMTRRRLVEFGVLCTALTWVPYLFLGVLKADLDQPVPRLVFGLAASGPSLAALVMWLWHRERRRGVWWSMGWPIAAVVLGAAAPLVATALIGNLSELPGHASSVIAGAGGMLGAAVYTLLAGPIAEEFGWRGYVQPRLRQYYGLGATTAILGTAWWLWHVPLFFLPGTGQHEDGFFTQQGLVFFLELFPLTFLMLFVTERLRGGVPAAILVHAAWNLSTELIPPLGNAVWLELAVVTAMAGAVSWYWRRTLPA